MPHEEMIAQLARMMKANQEFAEAMRKESERLKREREEALERERVKGGKGKGV